MTETWERIKSWHSRAEEIRSVADEFRLLPIAVTSTGSRKPMTGLRMALRRD
jgi:hypothetical protein